MSLSYCGKYKDAGLRMNKRIAGGIKKCQRCPNENYDGGKFCKTCREIVQAAFKERNKQRRIQRKQQKEAANGKDQG